jgi:hypothetical protein
MSTGWHMLAAGAVFSLGIYYGGGSAPENEGPIVPAPSKITVEAIDKIPVSSMRDGMIMPHYFKISGIAASLEASGVSIPASLGLRIDYANKLSVSKRAQYEAQDDMLTAFDMAHSEGSLEAKMGDWSLADLDSYVDLVMDLDERFVAIADSARAYLRDEGMSAEDSEHYVRRSIGLAYFDYIQPGLMSLEGDDDRLELRAAGHRGVVHDLHSKMHAFFQNRLDELDNVGTDRQLKVERPDVGEPGHHASLEVDI